jgi:hypothetical protein
VLRFCSRRPYVTGTFIHSLDVAPAAARAAGRCAAVVRQVGNIVIASRVDLTKAKGDANDNDNGNH